MTQERTRSLNELQERMGYSFFDVSLLDIALTHSSYSKGDGKGSKHYERLEYLGDAVLELCVSEILFNAHPDWPEGALTRARSSVVCESSLYEIAKDKLSLHSYLLLGHGEELSGGKDKPSIVSDAMEAVIGAVYLDGGLEAARALVLLIAEKNIKRAQGRARDHKTTLQEYAQKRRLGTVSYELKETKGPEHKKVFVMRVLIDGKATGEGTGQSKQEASQSAASAAMAKLKETKEG